MHYFIHLWNKFVSIFLSLYLSLYLSIYLSTSLSLSLFSFSLYLIYTHNMLLYTRKEGSKLLIFDQYYMSMWCPYTFRILLNTLSCILFLRTEDKFFGHYYWKVRPQIEHTHFLSVFRQTHGSVLEITFPPSVVLYTSCAWMHTYTHAHAHTHMP